MIESNPSGTVNTPMLSVITVVYNAVQEIEATMLSVLNQDYQDFEYIIIDGASTDGTLEVIKRYKGRLVHLVSEPDKGIYDAMNKGLALARGRYVAFKNAGDTYSDGSLTLAMQVAQSTNAALVYGNTEKLWPAFDGNESVRSLLTSDHSLLRLRSCLDHRSAFVRRDIHRPFDTQYRLAADYDLFCELLIRGFQFEKINQVLSVMQGGGASDNVGIYHEIKRIQTRYFGGLYATYNYYRLHLSYAKLKAQDRILRLVLGPDNFRRFKGRKNKR